MRIAEESAMAANTIAARPPGMTRAQRMAVAGWLFVLPALLLYLYFVIYPFLVSIYYSLTDWDGAQTVKRFVGLANYQELLTDDLMWESLWHNLIWIVIGTAAPIVIGLLL